MTGREEERFRIEFLIARDGEFAAKKWVEQTRAIYVEKALRESRYWDSIQEFDAFLEEFDDEEKPEA